MTNNSWIFHNDNPPSCVCNISTIFSKYFAVRRFAFIELKNETLQRSPIRVNITDQTKVSEGALVAISKLNIKNVLKVELNARINGSIFEGDEIHFHYLTDTLCYNARVTLLLGRGKSAFSVA